MRACLRCVSASGGGRVILCVVCMCVRYSHTHLDCYLGFGTHPPERDLKAFEIITSYHMLPNGFT